MRGKVIADTAKRFGGRRIDRIGPMDLTVLVTDRGSVPMNIGAVLEFDPAGGPSLAAVRALLSERVPTIPRLRQRLRRVPFGCGRPVWVDDPDFALDRHLLEREWLPPGGDRQLLDVAAELLCQRLDTDRALWRACLLTDSVGSRAAPHPGAPPRARRRTWRFGHLGCACRSWVARSDSHVSAAPAAVARAGP